MRPATLLLLCPLVLACGPKEGSDDTSAGETSAGPTTDGAAESGATSTPTSGAAASTSDETTEDSLPGTASSSPSSSSSSSDPTGDDVCGALADIDPSPEVMISLRNERSTPVFLLHVNFCDQVPLIDMAGSSSQSPLIWTLGMCGITCGQAVDGVCGCPPFCPNDSVLRIDPGGVHAFAWTGALFEATAVPQECGVDCGDSCMQMSQAPKGAYQLVARASTSAILCEDPECACTPNADGWCHVSASGIGAELVLAEAILDYPRVQQISLTFAD